MKLSLNQVVGLIAVRSDFFTAAKMTAVGHDKSSNKSYQPSQADIDAIGKTLDLSYDQIFREKHLMVEIFGVPAGKTTEEVKQEALSDSYRLHAEACDILITIAKLLDLDRPSAWRDR